MWRKTIFNIADRILTPWHDHDIDFASPMALKSWQWIHQVAAPCNVIRNSGMTCHWIRPNVRHIRILRLVSISTTSPQATCNSATVSDILSKSDHPRQEWRNVHFQDGESQPSWILGIQWWVLWKAQLQLTKLLSFPKNRVFAFWRQHPTWRISAILDFRGPIMGSLKSAGTTSYRSLIDTVALNRLVFEKIAFLHVGVKIQDGGSPPSWMLGVQ